MGDVYEFARYNKKADDPMVLMESVVNIVGHSIHTVMFSELVTGNPTVRLKGKIHVPKTNTSVLADLDGADVEIDLLVTEDAYVSGADGNGRVAMANLTVDDLTGLPVGHKAKDFPVARECYFGIRMSKAMWNDISAVVMRLPSTKEDTGSGMKFRIQTISVEHTTEMVVDENNRFGPFYLVPVTMGMW